MKKSVLLLIGLLLLSILSSGCVMKEKGTTVTVTETETYTETKYVPVTSAQEQTHNEQQLTTSTIVTPQGPERVNVDCSNWRNDVKAAVVCALDEEELNKVGAVLQMMTTNELTVTQTLAAITLFESMTYEIDKEKEDKASQLGHYFDIRKPSEIITDENNTKVTMAELTLLNVAFLLNMKSVPVYFIEVKTEKGIDVEAVTKIEGRYFVIGPFLLPLNLGTYFEELTKEAGSLVAAALYEVKAVNGQLELYKVKDLTAQDFLKNKYEFKKEDLQNIELAANVLLQKSPVFKPLENSQSMILMVCSVNQNNDYCHLTSSELDKIFYDAAFNDEFAELLVNLAIMDDEEIQKNLWNYKYYYFKVEEDGEKIRGTLYLLKKVS